MIENDAESATLCKAPATDIHTHTFDLAGQYLKWTCFGLCAKAQDIPPDALALLDMNGIDVTGWKRLQHLQYGYDA